MFVLLVHPVLYCNRHTPEFYLAPYYTGVWSIQWKGPPPQGAGISEDVIWGQKYVKKKRKRGKM
jgi:hypothetical protein